MVGGILYCTIVFIILYSYILYSIIYYFENADVQ